MIAAIAMTMQKHIDDKIETLSRVDIIYDTISLNEAVGIAVCKAKEELVDYQISSIAKIEVKPLKESFTSLINKHIFLRELIGEEADAGILYRESETFLAGLREGIRIARVIANSETVKPQKHVGD